MMRKLPWIVYMAAISAGSWVSVAAYAMAEVSADYKTASGLKLSSLMTEAESDGGHPLHAAQSSKPSLVRKSKASRHVLALNKSPLHRAMATRVLALNKPSEKASVAGEAVIEQAAVTSVIQAITPSIQGAAPTTKPVENLLVPEVVYSVPPARYPEASAQVAVTNPNGGVTPAQPPSDIMPPSPHVAPTPPPHRARTQQQHVDTTSSPAASPSSSAHTSTVPSVAGVGSKPTSSVSAIPPVSIPEKAKPSSRAPSPAPDSDDMGTGNILPPIDASSDKNATASTKNEAEPKTVSKPKLKPKPKPKPKVKKKTKEDEDESTELVMPKSAFSPVMYRPSGNGSINQEIVTEDAVRKSQEWIDAKDKFTYGEDGKIVYTYGVGMPVIVCAPMRITDLELQPGERINGQVHAGDSTRWIISPAESGSGSDSITHLIIKPREAGLETNIIIPTDRRVYHLKFVSSEKNYVARVAFNYPDDVKKQWAIATAPAARSNDVFKNAADSVPGGGWSGGSAGATGAASSVANMFPERLFFDYDIEGSSASWKPIRAFDDGQKTFIQVPPEARNGEVPALMIIGPDRFEQLVNYRYRDNYYVVDRIFDQAVLLIGVGRSQQKVTITRRSGKRSSWKETWSFGGDRSRSTGGDN